MQELQEQVLDIKEKFVAQWNEDIQVLDRENRAKIDAFLEQNFHPKKRQTPFRLSAARNINRQINSERNLIAPDCLDDDEMVFDVPDSSSFHIFFQGETKKVTTQPYVFEWRERLPISSTWTAIQKNYRAEDQPELGYMPYLGDKNLDNAVSKYFTKMKKPSDMEKTFEERLAAFTLEKLEASGVPTTELEQPEMKQTIATYLDLSSPRRLAKAAPTREVQPTTKKKSQIQEHADIQERRYLEALDSFRSVFCRQCYMYDCNLHGYKMTIPSLEIQQQEAYFYRDIGYAEAKSTDKVSTSVPCSETCWKISTSTLVGYNPTATQLVIIEKSFQISCGNFCEMKDIVGDLSCADLAKFCQDNDLPVQQLQDKVWQNGNEYIKKRNQKKKLYSAVFTKRAHDSQQVIPSFTPCAHEGPCKEGICPCMDRNNFCTKHCSCIGEFCGNFFPGCRCSRKCRTKQCPCFAAARECDVDLCRGCDPNSDPAEDACHNQTLRYRLHKRLLLGLSEVPGAGWGVFSDHQWIKRDEFIHEYGGEIISQEEAERRGDLYDKLNRSYLFNLNTEYVVDAARNGNKTKFANHSKKPNCYTRVVNVGSEHMIGIYALHDIPPHTELFFDYRYDQELVHEDFIKDAMVVDWMKDPFMAGKVTNTHN